MNKVRLSEIAKIIMGQSPKGETCNQEGIGKPLLNGPTEFGDFYPTAKQFTTEGNKFSVKGDILFCVRGSTTGRMNWANKEYVLGRGLASIRHKKGKELNHYLKYLIDFNLNAILKSTSGSTFPNLTGDMLNSFEVVVLDDTNSRKVNDFLKSIDAKIELNNKINRELESMAKTLYDYWFVQFDFPDANGRPYKSSGGKMVYNAELKREIPEGWEVKPINTKVKIGSGFPFNSDDYSDTGKYKIITIKNVQEGYLETSSVDYVSFLPNNISAFCILKEGDILMSLTGNVGRMCFVDQSNLLLNQRVGKLLGEKDFVTYAYFFFKRPENQKRLEKIAGGSSQANLSPIDAVKDKFPIPTASVLNNFTQLVNPLLNQILIKNQENQHLTALRDWLLPMLMNGQVMVKEAEDPDSYRENMAAEPSSNYGN